MGTNPLTCPWCGQSSQGATCVNSENAPPLPRPGDALVCHQCLGVYLAWSDGTAKPLRDDELFMHCDARTYATIIAAKQFLSANPTDDE